jgi:hypothetical protein
LHKEEFAKNEGTEWVAPTAMGMAVPIQPNKIDRAEQSKQADVKPDTIATEDISVSKDRYFLRSSDADAQETNDLRRSIVNLMSQNTKSMSKRRLSNNGNRADTSKTER